MAAVSKAKLIKWGERERDEKAHDDSQSAPIYWIVVLKY